MEDDIFDKIVSVELDASRPFEHYIQFKDDTGWVVDQMKVPDSKSMEIFKEVYKAWMEKMNEKNIPTKNG